MLQLAVIAGQCTSTLLHDKNQQLFMCLSPESTCWHRRLRFRAFLEDFFFPRHSDLFQPPGMVPRPNGRGTEDKGSSTIESKVTKRTSTTRWLVHEISSTGTLKKHLDSVVAAPNGHRTKVCTERAFREPTGKKDSSPSRLAECH